MPLNIKSIMTELQTFEEATRWTRSEINKLALYADTVQEYRKVAPRDAWDTGLDNMGLESAMFKALVDNDDNLERKLIVVPDLRSWFNSSQDLYFIDRTLSQELSENTVRMSQEQWDQLITLNREYSQRLKKDTADKTWFSEKLKECGSTPLPTLPTLTKPVVVAMDTPKGVLYTLVSPIQRNPMEECFGDNWVANMTRKPIAHTNSVLHQLYSNGRGGFDFHCAVFCMIDGGIQVKDIFTVAENTICCNSGNFEVNNATKVMAQVILRFLSAVQNPKTVVSTKRVQSPKIKGKKIRLVNGKFTKKRNLKANLKVVKIDAETLSNITTLRVNPNNQKGSEHGYQYDRCETTAGRWVGKEKLIDGEEIVATKPRNKGGKLYLVRRPVKGCTVNKHKERKPQPTLQPTITVGNLYRR